MLQLEKLLITWLNYPRVSLYSRSRYDPAYGARPLRRTIQREVETVLAKLIISGEITAGDSLVADVVNERLSIAAKDVIDAGHKSPAAAGLDV